MDGKPSWKAGERLIASATKPAIVETEEFGKIEIYRLPDKRLAIVLRVSSDGKDPVVLRRAGGDITFYRHGHGKVGIAFPHGVKVQKPRCKLDKTPPTGTNNP